MTSILKTPVETPCGLVFPNRLVCSAMSEGMSEDGNPGDKYVDAYTTWAAGGWGGQITGNVEVSSTHKGSNATMHIPPHPTPTTHLLWSRYAHAVQHTSTPGIIQLVHPGRQSPLSSGSRSFWSKTIAPSPIPLNLGPGLIATTLRALVFGTPREMSVGEIEEVVQQFAHAAKVVSEAGFKGVQIHAAHGYLLSQFLSPESNVRTDKYGGSAANRARIVVEILRAVRSVVPKGFCVGIKLNSADVNGKESLEESLEQVGIIEEVGVDFLEISGGSYENPRMATGDTSSTSSPSNNPSNTPSSRTAHREAFFLSYASSVRARYPHLILMVTGGFRSRLGMVAAIESNACDLIGIGRPAAVYPHCAKEVYLNESVGDEEARVDLQMVRPSAWVGWVGKWVRLVGAGVDTIYYGKQIARMGVGEKPVPPPRY